LPMTSIDDNGGIQVRELFQGTVVHKYSLWFDRRPEGPERDEQEINRLTQYRYVMSLENPSITFANFR